MSCYRCDRRNSIAETLAATPGLIPPVSVPHDMCFHCALEDPAHRAAMEQWGEQMKAYSKERLAKSFQHLREWAARPLEAIDRFIDSLR